MSSDCGISLAPYLHEYTNTLQAVLDLDSSKKGPESVPKKLYLEAPSKKKKKKKKTPSVNHCSSGLGPLPLMSPPPPPKSPGVGVGDPLPVVGSDRPQTPVDGGEFLDLLVSSGLYRLLF